jgi:hypothetical protein
MPGAFDLQVAAVGFHGTHVKMRVDGKPSAVLYHCQALDKHAQLMRAGEPCARDRRVPGLQAQQFTNRPIR